MLFNHQSPLRGEMFVTSKIALAIARDYVEMQWLLLQREQPEHFAIATCVQYSSWRWPAPSLIITLILEGSGEIEAGIVTMISPVHGEMRSNCKIGDVNFRVDSVHSILTLFESLLGDPSKAERLVGWRPKIMLQ